MSASCPLWDGRSATRVDHTNSTRLARAYRRQWGVDVCSWLSTHRELNRIHLCECDVCGLQFFDPSIAGDADFYALLAAAYVDTRWEFERARAFVEGAAVADLGCGPGRFLLSIQDVAGRLVGNDHNGKALGALRGRGIEVCEGPVGRMMDQYGPEFDVVTAFHVLEHVPRPMEVLEVAAGILRPGGVALVSVPNRGRLVRRRLEPFDWPPHHLTRWSETQLAMAARQAGFRVRAIEREPTIAASRLAGWPPAIGIFAFLARAGVHGSKLNLPRPFTCDGFLAAGQGLLAVLDEGPG